MTKKYSYTEAMYADIKEYIEENDIEVTADTDKDDLTEQLYDDLWIVDSVTGNGSGSYTFDRAKAREYVLADPDALREALTEFCVPADEIAEKFLAEDWEYFDVTIRCYYLGMVIDDVVTDMMKNAE